MSQLTALKNATRLADLAHLLSTSTKGLAYVLYKIPESSKYQEFEIPKKYGGLRKICAPVDSLRLLQRRLSDLLQNCLEEIEASGEKKSGAAHGFKRKRSIVTNAAAHRR